MLLVCSGMGAQIDVQPQTPTRIRRIAGRATITAASCNYADVNAVINGPTHVAQNGDVIQIPAGACTWATSLQVTGKAITVVGAGAGTDPATNTILTDQTGTGFVSGLFWVTNLVASSTTTAASFDLSQLRILFNGTAAAGGPGTLSRSGAILNVNGTLFALRAFRIHNINFVITVVSRAIIVNNIYGLVDHINYDATALPSSVSQTFMHATLQGTDGGGTSWNRPLALGTENAVYIEDNNLTNLNNNNSIIDGYQGVRYVIRHNIINNATVGFHGTDSGPFRSAFSWEIYSNTYNYSPTPAVATPMFDNRGGTGVIYHNQFHSGTAAFTGIKNSTYRACAGNRLLGSCSVTTAQQCGVDSDCPYNETCRGWCSNHATTSCSITTDCTGPPNNWTGDTCTFPYGIINQWGSQRGTCSITASISCNNSARCPAGETCGGTIGAAGGTEGTSPLPQRFCDGTQWENPTSGFATTASRQVCLNGAATCVDQLTPNNHYRWCAAHPDTQCQAGPAGDATCNALQAGDTCTRFFDGNGTQGYPCRDASGVTHDQVPSPIYIWNNQCFNSGGTSIACPAAGPNGDSGCTTSPTTQSQPQAGRDFIESATDAGAKPGYTAYVYPHPLQGTPGAPVITGSGTIRGQGKII